MNCVAQNLVPNPGFEEYKKLPYTFSNTCKEFTKTVEKWIMPNEATSDYFNLKAGGKVNAKKNFAGIQLPREGQAYAGLIVYQSQYANYREYLEVKLNSKLKAGKKYIVQFYISLAEQSEFAVDRLGIYIGKKPEHQKDMEVLNIVPTIETKDSLFFDDEKNWVCIRDSFVATGKENYLVIGNFHKTHEMHLKAVPLNKKKYVKGHETYYYIDDVCLSEEKEDGSSSCLCDPPDTTVIADGLKRETLLLHQNYVNDSIARADSILMQTALPNNHNSGVLCTVLFDTGKWNIKPESYPGLDSLVNFMKKNPEQFIELSGYTDSIGDESLNKVLSEKRAEAVGKFLIARGISKDRVSWEGFGSASPVATNETLEGRMRNRRVEYRWVRY